MVVWLLSQGADPNGYIVMYYGAYNSASSILQLLIDAGGDVNRESHGRPPLVAAVAGDNSSDNVRVLLAQPTLDFTIKCSDRTPEQYALDVGYPVLADLIAQEVSAFWCVFELPMELALYATVLTALMLLWSTEGETSGAGSAGTTTRIIGFCLLICTVFLLLLRAWYCAVRSVCASAREAKAGEMMNVRVCLLSLRLLLVQWS